MDYDYKKYFVFFATSFSLRAQRTFNRIKTFTELLKQLCFPLGAKYHLNTQFFYITDAFDKWHHGKS